MRVATMVISLILMLVVFVQSCAVAVGGSIGEDEDLSGAGAIGVLVALLFLVGGAFVLGLPTVSIVAFGLAAVFAFAGGAGSDFEDLVIWGVVAVILAVMSYFGRREKRRSAARAVAPSAERDPGQA